MGIALQSMLSSTLLWEWQQNELKNVLDVHSTAERFLHKHQRLANVVTIGATYHEARGHTCVLWANELWKMSLSRSIPHTEMTITSMKTEFALITEPYILPFDPPGGLLMIPLSKD